MSKLYSKPTRHADIIERLTDPHRRLVIADREEAAEIIKHLTKELAIIAQPDPLASEGERQIMNLAHDTLQRIGFIRTKTSRKTRTKS